MSSRRDTWEARYRDASAEAAQPAAVLREHAYLLPAEGAALDVACGLGGNALFLAARDLRVSAWDISARAVAALQETASRRGVSLRAEVRDVEAAPPAPESFDVITVSRFLSRPLCAHLGAALRSDGLLYYQTFVRDKVAAVGPTNPDYLLAENELLRLFAGLRVLVFRDEGSVGEVHRGVRNEAWLVARKPGREAR